MEAGLHAAWKNLDGSPPKCDFTVACGRCATYRFGGSPFEFFDAWRIPPEDNPYLSCATRQSFERGHPLVLHEERLKQIASDHRHTLFSHILDKALGYLAHHSRPGEDVHIVYNTAYPLFDLTSAEQAIYLFGQLRERQLVEDRGDGRYRLTARGWEAVEPVSRGGVAGLCFVAMSFDPSMHDSFERGFLPAIETDCNLKAERIDQEHFYDRICDRIISDLRKAQFIVADLSLHRRNVYFEAGFAMGLGRPVIWTCRADDMEKAMHQFDTQQYQHLFWSSPDDLRKKLSIKIKALGFERG